MHLNSLDLAHCGKVTDAGLQHVARCAQLASLNLFCCRKVTAAGLQHLARCCTQLASLKITGVSKMTDEGIAQLTRQLPAGCTTEMPQLTLLPRNAAMRPTPPQHNLAGPAQVRALIAALGVAQQEDATAGGVLPGDLAK